MRVKFICSDHPVCTPRGTRRTFAGFSGGVSMQAFFWGRLFQKFSAGLSAGFSRGGTLRIPDETLCCGLLRGVRQAYSVGRIFDGTLCNSVRGRYGRFANNHTVFGAVANRCRLVEASAPPILPIPPILGKSSARWTLDIVRQTGVVAKGHSEDDTNRTSILCHHEGARRSLWQQRSQETHHKIWKAS